MHQKIASSLNKNTLLIAIAVVAILVTGFLVSNKNASQNILSFLKLNPGMSNEAIAKKSIDYLNASVLQKGQTATLVSVSEESGLVKIKLKIGTNTYDSHATKDGKLLFPESFAIDATAKTKPTAQNTQNNKGEVTPATVAKVAKTSLDAYIVSSCPFGLQMARAMKEAVKNIPSLAKYIKIRYIGSVASDGKTITAMHGKEEADNNFIQIGIREEQPDKFWPYMSCYMEVASNKAANGMPYGDTKKCQRVAGVDSAKLNACIADPKRCLAYAKADFDLANKFGVQGSPTLVLNNQEISETPFGGRSADSIRNLVCSSSVNQPDFCKTKLNTKEATTSFSLTSTKDSLSATAVANTACAPAVQ